MTRKLPVPALCASVLALLLAAPAAAQTLYLGEHEVDTADRGQVRAAIERCASLAAAAPDAQQAAAFTRGSATPEASPATPAAEQMPRGEAAPAEPSGEAPADPVDRAALSLSVDALASSGGGSAASGDGGESGEGWSNADTGDGTGDDLASVILRACKEAGLVY